MNASDREAGINRLSNIDIPISHPYYLTYYFLLNSIEKAAKTYAKGRLLDIGCGNKPYHNFFKNSISEHIGCDIVQSNENKVDVVCEATDIPLNDETFDTILCTQVIEHVADHNKLLAEAYRLLKPGGYLILTGPMYWPIHEEPYDFFRFTKYGFRHLLTTHRFEHISTEEHGGKWAVLGQAICLTLPKFMGRHYLMSITNRLFLYLDKKHYDPQSTTNYLVIGQKK